MSVKVISAKKGERKVNCYKCKYCDDVPGSAHKMCLYALKDPNNSFVNLISLLGGFRMDVPHMNVVLIDTGVKGGWCNFPFNFDPIWVYDCDKFTPKGEQNEKEKRNHP